MSFAIRVAVLALVGARSLAAAQTPPAPSAINHAGIRVELDTASGQPAVLADTRSGIALRDIGVAFAVRLPRVEQNGWIDMDAFERESTIPAADGFRSVYRCRDDAMRNLAVETAMRIARDGRLIFTCAVSNRSEHAVIAVRYPVLSGLSLAGYGPEALFVPVHSGLFFDRPREQPLTWEGHYPRFCMGWMDYYTPTGGVMLLTDSRDLTQQELTVQSRQNQIRMQMGLRDGILPGEIRTFTNSIVLHAGDWRVAAAIYRTHFNTAFGAAPAYPDWVRRSNGYLSFSYLGPKPGGYAEETPKLLYDTWHLGLEHVQIWGQTGHHACPAYYLPSAQRGGEAAFIRMIGTLRGSGLHVGAYFLATGASAYHAQADAWPGVDDKHRQVPADLQPPDWPWLLRQAVVPDWQAPVHRMFTTHELAEIKRQALYDKQHFHCSFLSDEFRDGYFGFWVDRYINVYGLDVPYLDVFSRRPKFQEFNPFLGRYADGSEGIVRRRFIGELRERHQARTRGGLLVLTEGVIDAYNDRAGALISNISRPLGPNSFQPTVAYRTVFPGALLYEGHANGWWGPGRRVRAIAHAVLNGNRFDLLGTFAMQDDVRDLVWMRDALTGFLESDRFQVFDPGAAGLAPPLEARGFHRPGAALFTLFNPECKTNVTLRLADLHPAIRNAFLFAPGAAPVTVAATPGAALTLPAATACAVLAGGLSAGRPDPAVGCLPAQLPDGGTRFTFYAANPRAQPVSLRWSAQRLSDGALPPAAGTAVIAPGAVWSTNLTASAPHPPRRERARFIADWGDGSREVRRTIEPLHAVNGVVEVAATSIHSLHLARGLRYRLSFEVFRTASSSVMAAVHDSLRKTDHCRIGLDTAVNTWERRQVDFETHDQSWLRLYVYNRPRGGTAAPEPARFRNMTLVALGDASDSTQGGERPPPRSDF